MDWSFVRRLLVRSPLAYELRKHLDFAPALFAGKAAGAKRRWSQDGEDAFLAEHLRPYIDDGFFIAHNENDRISAGTGSARNEDDDLYDAGNVHAHNE